MNIKLRFSDLREELLIPVKELQEQLDFFLVSEERQGFDVTRFKKRFHGLSVYNIIVCDAIDIIQMIG